MIVHHDLRLVVASVIVSVIAAYGARDLTERLSQSPRNRVWAIWLTVGATVDAIGIFAMHYTAKLALQLPVSLRLDWRIVLVSLGMGMIGSASSMVIVTRQPIGWRRAFIAGVLLGGVGISGLHYTAMSAVLVPAVHHSSIPIMIMSVVLGMMTSFGALWLTFGWPPHEADRTIRCHAGALLRGLANPVMHYTAMSTATFTVVGTAPDLSHAVGILPLGIFGLVVSPVTVGVVALLTSVVDRVQRHHVLLAELFEQSPLPVALTTIPDYRVVRVNREFTNLFGYTRQEIEGSELRELIVPPDVLEREREYLDRLLHGQRVEVETVRRRRDGTRVDVSIVGVPVTLPGGEKQLYAIYTDLTERKRAEEEIRQTQKLESIGRLAGGIAHDFNNLLTVITGYSEMVLAELGRGHPACEAVEEIAKAAARASSLTHQLLLFTRRQAVGREPVLVNDLVLNLEKMLSRLLGEDVQLILSLNADPGVIHANASQIDQVLINLAVNSRDAMPNGGRLVIETANVWLDEQFARTHVNIAPGPYVQLTVSDTGVGMTPDVKARVFEPFFTTKGPGKGTGLGLATAYGIVKQYEGCIILESEPGQGTTFKIFFPAATAPTEPSLPAVTRHDLSGTETILVVEDEAGVRKYVRDILVRQGYHVLEAGNGREAIEVARQHAGPIHLLLTDVVMPEMGGLDLAERFASERPGVPVLYMSGYSDRLWRQNMSAQSIQKPFASVALLTRIRELLARV